MTDLQRLKLMLQAHMNGLAKMIVVRTDSRNTWRLEAFGDVLGMIDKIEKED